MLFALENRRAVVFDVGQEYGTDGLAVSSSELEAFE